MPKYKLVTNDTLKCAACGNKTFAEKQVDMSKMGAMEQKDCWIYVCEDCGHCMAFKEKATEKE